MGSANFSGNATFRPFKDKLLSSTGQEKSGFRKKGYPAAESGSGLKLTYRLQNLEVI